MEQQEPRRRTLKRRVQSFIYRVVPSLDAAQGAQRYRQYIKSSEKEILDLLAFEQVASLMGSPSDFDVSPPSFSSAWPRTVCCCLL